MRKRVNKRRINWLEDVCTSCIRALMRTETGTHRLEAGAASACIAFSIHIIVLSF